MKIALIIVGLAAAYLVGHLLMVWRSRNENLPKTPPGGWKKPEDREDEDDWPQRPQG